MPGTVILRDLRREDRDQIRVWRNSREVASNMLTDHEISVQEHNRWFDFVFNDKSYKLWIIEFKSKPAGLANLFDISTRHRRCFFSIYVGEPSMRGQGVGNAALFLMLQYAFEKIEMNKVCCECLSTNAGAAAMYEKFGGTIEGRLREHYIKSTGHVDVLQFGWLRSDWNAIKASLEGKLSVRGLI